MSALQQAKKLAQVLRHIQNYKWPMATVNQIVNRCLS